MMLLLASVSLVVQAPVPRLQWAYDGGRVVNRYAGKWADVGKATVLYTEAGRTADVIALKDANGRELRLTATTDGTRAGAWTAKFEAIDLGSLSEKYESGGRGPATVSTGVGDPGGVSYGTYQLASKVGRADQFAAKYYPNEFAGLKGGSPEFTAAWKALAAKDPAALHAHEHAYIKASHFDPQVAKLKRDLNLDATTWSRTLQDAVWSTAVQHGPNADVIVVAAKAKPTTEADWLKAIYAERGRLAADGKKLARFRGVSEAWIPGLTKRFTNELADAAESLK